jgi:hypothetical protein
MKIGLNLYIFVHINIINKKMKKIKIFIIYYVIIFHNIIIFIIMTK